MSAETRAETIDGEAIDLKRRKWREARRLYCLRHPAKVIASTLAWRAKNPEKCKEYGKTWERKNRSQQRAYRNRWARTNRTKRELSTAKWRAKNPERWKAIRRAGHARRKAWIRKVPIGDSKPLLKIYARCLQLRKWFDVQVDHIIPLSKGGRHEPGNLQILHAHENMLKGNRMDYVPSVIFA